MSLSGRVFVGREREVAELVAALHDAAAGKGSCRLIGGEPGIGKSRLADELAEVARDRGVRVLWGRAWEAGGAPAYWPWIHSLRPLVADALGTGSLAAAQMALLVQLFTEIRPQGAEVPLNLDEEGVRFRLFEAIAEMLRVASGRQPILLIIEDIDAADTPSVLLLRHVGGVISGMHVLLVATYRDEGLARGRPLQAVIADLLRDASTSQLRLMGLTPGDVERYMEATLGQSPSRELVNHVHRETEGNPLFVGEVVRLLGAQPDSGSGVYQIEDVVIPETVRETIRRRLEPLPEPLRETLMAASVLGREFSSDALASMTGLRAAELFVLLDEAVENRLLTESMENPGRFRFIHILIRDTLYDELRPSRRASLHLAAAAALKEQHAADLESHVAEVAHHQLRAGPAGDPEDQVSWARRAAERAVGMLAYEEAARILERALQVIARRSGDLRLRCDLFQELGDARARAGDKAPARDAFLAAAELAHRLELPDQLARAALGYGGRFVWEAGRGDPHLVPLLRGALEALGDRSEPLRAKVLARLAGGPLRDDPRREERDRLSAEAVALARRLADPGLLAYVLIGRYAAIWWPDNLDERLDLARELVAVSREAGDREHELQAHHYLCLALLETGDIAGAESEASEQIRLAEELRQPSQSFYVGTVEAMLALLHGHFGEAEEFITRAYESGRRAEPTMARIYRVMQLHALRRAQGRLHDVLREIDAVVKTVPTYVVLRCVLVDSLRELGRTAEARREFAALAADRFAAVAQNDEWVFAMCLLAESAAEMEMRSEAVVLREQLEPYRGRVALSAPDSCFGAVDRVLGLLDRALGNESEAREHLEAAVSLNETLRSPHWAAAARLELARLLLRPGGDEERERSAALLRDVASVARDLGMPALQQQALVGLESARLPATGARIARTFMFTDIVRSTDLIEAIGDEAWEDLLGWHDRTLMAAFDAHGSEHVQHRGDGFFTVFGRASAAVECALEIQDMLARHRRSQGFAPSVRIGVHTAAARLAEGTYSGQGVHAAARIGALAGAGEILASLATIRGLRDVRHGPVRTERLKGIRDPIEVVRLERAAPSV